MSKTVALVVARTSSSRLPRKVLLPVAGMTMLEYIIRKLQRARRVDQVVICTSENRDDEVLQEVANRSGVGFYAGSLDRVIDRMLGAAKMAEADDIVRVTGDNIFTDEVYLDLMIEQHLKSQAEYTRTEYLPLGVTAEIMKTDALKRCREMIDPEMSEYLMLYMYQPSLFKCLVLIPESDHQYPHWNLSVDTPADWERSLAIVGQSAKPLRYDEVLAVCRGGGIPNLEMLREASVKFPGGVVMSMKATKVEMEERMSRSHQVRLDAGTYASAVHRSAD